jgi:hypothetical protein
MCCVLFAEPWDVDEDEIEEVIERMINLKTHQSAFTFLEECLLAYYNKWAVGMSHEIEGFDNGELTFKLFEGGFSALSTHDGDGDIYCVAYDERDEPKAVPE